MTDNGNKGVYEFFWKHPAIAGSLVFLFMTAVGVLYSWKLYSLFELNIFNYAEPNDFLMAAFKEKKSAVFSVFTIVYVGVSFVLLKFFLKNLSWPTAVSLTFIVGFGIIFSALDGAESTKKDIENEVSFKFDLVLRNGEQHKDLSLIGSVDNYSFFLDKNGNVLIFGRPHIILIKRKKK